MEYIRNSHSVYLLTYHIVFVTKYRRPVIDDRISAFLKDHISYLCSRFDAELLTAETDRDHIHLLISMPAEAGACCPDPRPEYPDSEGDPSRPGNGRARKEIHLWKRASVAAFLFRGDDRHDRHGKG